MEKLSNTSSSPDLAALQQTQKNYKKALHQAILLKARNPQKNVSQNLNTPTLSSSLFACTMSPLNTKPSQQISQQQQKLANTSVQNLGSNSSPTSNSSSSSILIASQSSQESTDLLSLATSQLFSQLNDEFNFSPSKTIESIGDELQTPQSINQNITSSLRSLKQTLDPRPSVSGEEQPGNNRSSYSNDVIIIGSLLPNVNHNSTQVKMAIPLKQNHTNINIPKLPSTGNLPIKSINLSSLSLLSSNSLNSQLASPIHKSRIGKRLKGDTLNNASSSDEEDQQQQSRPRLGNKLQQLVTSSPKVISKVSQILMTLPTTTFNYQQPKITPVVSAVERSNSTNSNGRDLNQTQSSQLEIPCQSLSNLLNQSMESSTSDLANLSFVSTTKSVQSKSLDSPDLSFSCVASPTSCCSSYGSGNNDSAIDLHDDNSSTASEPIYIRQPGFEHHAHEVQLDETTLFNLEQTLTTTAKKKKLNEKNISFLTSGLSVSGVSKKPSNKCKKKLCLMIGDKFSGVDTGINLKPLSSKSKREPLPMRLRALPLSFWQQPNVQQNVQPSSMYLPPLLKSIDPENSLETVNTSLSDEVACDSRQVQISSANTDLLFKLFDQVENSIKNQQQFKIDRVCIRQPTIKCKTLTKDEDPCIGVNSMADDVFPFIKSNSRASDLFHVSTFKPAEPNTMLSSNVHSFSSPTISADGDISIINQFTEQNYSQALSDVVAAL